MTELSLVAKATVVLGLGLVTTWAARRAPASVRSMILASTLGLLLVLPIVSALASPRELQVPQALTPVFFVEEPTVATTGVSVAATPTGAAAPTSRWPLPSPAWLFRVVWAFGFAVTVTPLLLGLWRARALSHRGHDWKEGRTLAATLAASAGVHRALSVVCDDRLVAPMTCGWLRPTVGMPADAPRWPAADVRRALLHELEHVRRGDWPIHILARLACAIYWFHPAVWVAWRQLSLESERACDDAVVMRAEDTAYAEQLVSLARRLAAGTTAPLLSMADRRTLATRVAAILNRNVARGRVRAAYGAAIILGAAALCVAVSPLQAVAYVATPLSPSQQTTGAATFEVASIRRNNSSRPGQMITLRGNTFLAENVTVHDLVITAFRVNSDQVSGTPGWASSERYDVLGRPASEATWEQHLQMLQRLLADRLNLSIRREMREVPAYALVVSRNGPKLNPRSDTCAPSPTGVKCGGFSTRPGHFTGRHVTVAQVAALLSNRSGRPVENKTALDGFFDVELTWTPDPGQLPQGPGPDDARPFDPSGPSLFTALEEQLGLKLEPSTTLVEHLVVERVERPTPNDAARPGGLQFEAASVRRRMDPGGGFMGVRPGGRFVAEGVSLQDLIVFSYLVQPYQIVDGPAWLDVERWDVNATGATGTRNDVLVALQRLLADRFSLTIRRDVRELPVYALVVARGDGKVGPQLARSSADCAALRAEAQRTGVIPPDAPRLCVAEGRLGSIRIGGAPLADLAPMLSTRVQRTVVDRTGLKGTWDLTLTYAPEPAQIPPGPLFPGVSFDPNGPSLFTALQEQLGLKLEATRAPVEVLVIERVDHPTAN
jgi:uncharacterized protein (TIGR03435 family)